MEQTELLNLMRQFDDSGLTKLEWVHDGVELRLEKAAATSMVMQNAPMMMQPMAAAPVQAIPALAAAPIASAQEDCVCVKAPLVGVYYASSAPGSAAFVQQGQQVKKGQVLCLIEAMKMMNELTCPIDGTLARICASNEEVVSFDQVLFEVVPC